MVPEVSCYVMLAQPLQQFTIQITGREVLAADLSLFGDSSSGSLRSKIMRQVIVSIDLATRVALT